MTIVLAFSTSTARGSVAVVGPSVLAEVSWDDARGHAERIVGGADAVLERAGIDRASLGAIACDVGPGSFTGVRVAVATGKGIALALGLPLVGVGSLDVMAFAAFREGVVASGEIALPVLDARRGEVFLAAWDAAMASVLVPAHVPRDAVAEAIAPLSSLGRPIVAVGSFAAELVAGAGLFIQHRAHPASDHPSATWIARVALERLGAATPVARAPVGPGSPFDPAAVEPCYLRPPDAKPTAR